MLIFQPVNWIESKYCVSFARIKLGVTQKKDFFFFFFTPAPCEESDKSGTISLT